MTPSELAESLPPTECPHGDDESHAGLGKAWCEAGLEGARLLQRREAARQRFLADAKAGTDEGRCYD